MNVQKVYEAVIANFNLKFNAATLKCWILALNDLPEEQLTNGLQRLLKDPDINYIPTPAKFKQYCLNEKPIKAMAEEAYGKVILSLSHDETPKFDECTSKVVHSLGDMFSLRKMTHDQLSFLKNRFITVYSELKNQENDTKELEYTKGQINYVNNGIEDTLKNKDSGTLIDTQSN